MSKEPVVLRVRNPADLAQQQHYHRVNALATSLIKSILVPVLTVPQVIPHGTPKANTDGSEIAGRYSETVGRLAEIELEARAFPLDWERQAKLEDERERLTARRDRLNDELAAIRLPGRGTRGGVPGLYAVKVGAIRYTGGMEGEGVEERWTLDTRTLPGDLRRRLDAYLASGQEAMPYRYQGHNCRYKAQSFVSVDIRTLMDALLSNATTVVDPQHVALLRERARVV